MSESSRLLQLRKFYGFTQKKIAEEILNMGQNAYSMIETGNVRLTNKNRSILVEKLKANPLWLETGIGDMFIDPNIAPQPPKSPKDYSNGLPYYEKPLTGPKLLSLDELAFEDPEFHINYPPFCDCSFYRPVYGESMSPRYNPSDVIACKKVLNKENILYGQAYLCIINNGSDFYETIKILRHHSDPAMVTLKPINQNFDETATTLDSIIELYIIKGKIERTL